MMLKKTLLLAASAVALMAGGAFAEGGKTFYWISHGGPADPVWTYFLQGAEAWAKETGNTVNTSFHSGDVPSQQEAVLPRLLRVLPASARPAPIRARWWMWSRKPVPPAFRS